LSSILTAPVRPSEDHPNSISGILACHILQDWRECHCGEQHNLAIRITGSEAPFPMAFPDRAQSPIRTLTRADRIVACAAAEPAGKN
jgi:hypothetical protein